ncbi:MAG TPA: cytochrome P450 [Ktedonobacteraceae bacterium]|jgi:cytochrome P450
MKQQTPLLDSSYFEQLFSPYPDFSITCVRPAYFDSSQQAWHVFRYAEVQRVLFDHKVFSTSRDHDFGAMEYIKDFVNDGMTNLDPPAHTRMRRFVTQAYHPRAAYLETRVQDMVEQLLAPVKAQGFMDLVDDFVHPLPSIIIAELLGIPLEDHLQFRHWAFTYMNFLSPESAQAEKRLIAYFETLVEGRRRHPGDDFISALLTAEFDGERLTTKEVIASCVFLIVAGQAPGTLLTNMILAFDAFAHVQPALRAYPEKIPGAIEEVFRFFAPVVSAATRITVTETVIDGQRIPQGSLVVPWIGAANRDPSQFVNPHLFDIDRSPNRHLTFGFGIHFCLGAHLARVIARISTNLLLQHLKDITLDHTVPLERVESSLLFTVKHAPITFRV